MSYARSERFISFPQMTGGPRGTHGPVPLFYNKDNLGATGFDRAVPLSVASRGAAGLVKSGKTSNCE